MNAAPLGGRACIHDKGELPLQILRKIAIRKVISVQPLPRRQQEILQATVHHYVDTIEPVGSRALVQRFGIKASSATVRSAMGALEQRGLLTQPHTSAGRVPSPQGYRHYVDCLLPEPGAGAHHLERELTQLSLRWAALDDLLLQLARRLTDFTGLMSLISPPQRSESQLRTIRLVRSEDRLLVMLVADSSQAHHLNLRLPHGSAGQVEALERWTSDQLINAGKLDWSCLPPQLQSCGKALQDALENGNPFHRPIEQAPLMHGVSRLVAEPEFSDSARVKPLLDLMDSDPAAFVPAPAWSDGRVWIGEEHPQTALSHCSVVHASYRGGDGAVGQVALIGPMRMAYATARAAVNSVALTLERLLN